MLFKSEKIRACLPQKIRQLSRNTDRKYSLLSTYKTVIETKTHIEYLYFSMANRDE